MNTDCDVAEITPKRDVCEMDVGWWAFAEGWSFYSNPYPAGSASHAAWAWAWDEARAGHLADLALRGGADPEDYK